jgi:hypothetical protein
MKKAILYIVTACIICCNYAFSSKCSFPYERNYNKDIILAAQELCAKLEAAYQSSSKNYLERFLRDWNESLPPNSVEFIKQNDIIKAIFDIYELINKPVDTLKAGNFSEITAYPLIMSQKSNYKYVIVQNKIYYEIIEKEDNFGKLIEMDFRGNFGNRDSINDFRPPLKLENIQALYSLPKYEEAFKMFLGVPFIRGKVNTNPLTARKDDDSKRYDFLFSHIPIVTGHWGDWRFVTPPEIYCIYFDKSITTAIVDFVNVNWGYIAIMKKEANEWTIDKIHLVWMT